MSRLDEIKARYGWCERCASHDPRDRRDHGHLRSQTEIDALWLVDQVESLERWKVEALDPTGAPKAVIAEKTREFRIDPSQKTDTFVMSPPMSINTQPAEVSCGVAITSAMASDSNSM